METKVLKIIATVIVIISTFYSDYKRKLSFKDYISYLGIFLFIYINLFTLTNDKLYLLVSIIYLIAILIYKKKIENGRNKT